MLQTEGWRISALLVHLLVYWRSRMASLFLVATVLLHYVPQEVTSVLVVFVIFGGLFLVDWYIGRPP